jgi:ElaB/YqjD/DUF883 family membrane-anchored ribosome-binding protein
MDMLSIPDSAERTAHMSTETTSRSGAQSPGGTAQAAAQQTKDGAPQVASTAGHEAKKVAREASDQARQLWQQARSDLTEQASGQQERAASGLRQLSDQMRSMVGGSEPGVARDLVDEVARRSGVAADWLEQRDPGSILEEARSFARRRPGTFLVAAAALGLVAGRLSRGLAEEMRDDSPGSASPAEGAPVSAAPVGDPGLAAPVGDPGLGISALPQETHKVTQPMEPDGTLAPIGDDGHLTGSTDEIDLRDDR